MAAAFSPDIMKSNCDSTISPRPAYVELPSDVAQGDIDREFLRFDPALGWVWTNSLAAVGGVITLVMGFLLNRVLFKPDAKREE